MIEPIENECKTHYYECPFCNLRSVNYEKVKEHIEKCGENPELPRRRCWKCKNSYKYMRNLLHGAFEEKYGCKLKVWDNTSHCYAYCEKVVNERGRRND